VVLVNILTSVLFVSLADVVRRRPEGRWGDLSAIVWEYWTEEEVCLVVKNSCLQCPLSDSLCTRVWSVIQLTSHVLPPSSENDCSKWAEFWVI
jgi:hypothetical protein